MPDRTCGTAALDYARRGWPVVALHSLRDGRCTCRRRGNCESPGKHPRTRNGLKDATADPETIRRWWQQWPDANVGICTGAESGLVVVDLDRHGDQDGIAVAQAQLGLETDAHDGPVARTGGGGLHLLFAHPGAPVQNRTGPAAPAPGVEVKGDGGYVVAPPSTHVSGRPYSWHADPELLDGPLPPLPAWVLNGLATADCAASEAPDGGGIIPSGFRNAALARLGGAMRRVGMGEAEILAALRTTNAERCSPPLDEGEVERVAASLARYIPDQVSVAAAEDWWGQDADKSTDGPPKGPDPLPDRLLHVPGFIARVMEYNLATAFRPQPVLALAGAICLQAILAARKIQDERGNRTNLYVVGVGPSGCGKDHPRKVIKHVLFHAGASQLEGPEDLASDAGLLKAVENNPAVLFQIDEIGRLMRTTNDSIHAHLFGITTALMRLYSSADTVFRGKAYADDKRNTEIPEPCVSLHGMTTPEHFCKALTVDNLSDGLLGRMLVFEVEGQGTRQRARLTPPPEEVRAAARAWHNYEPASGDLDGVRASQVLTVPATDEANEVFDALAAEVDSEMAKGDGPARSVWARAEEKACRLALIYAASRCDGAPVGIEVDGGAAQWAADLTTHLTRRMLRLAGDWVTDSKFDAAQKEVLRIIRSAGGEISRRDLWRKARKWSPKERSELVQNLLETGQVRCDLVPTGGRPREVYRLTWEG